MTVSCRIALTLLLVFASYPGRASAEEIRWRDAASFEIEGKGWARTAETGNLETPPPESQAFAGWNRVLALSHP